MMPPGIDRSQNPPLFQMGAYRFQRFCRDLYSREEGIATCEVFGINGQAQYGIDVLAKRSGRYEFEVAQCKCYEDFPASDIAEAGTQFLTYWDGFWSDFGVKKFVLIVSCDLEERSRQEEILQQTGIFRERGIDYEVWSISAILQRLRPFPELEDTSISPTNGFPSFATPLTQSTPQMLTR